MNESTPKRKIGYPYLIRINGKNNYKKAKKILHSSLSKKKLSKISKYVYDCKDFSTCISTTKLLIKNKIKNMDLGAYQTNYKFHPNKIEYYFDFENSFLLACKYHHQLINRYGYSWETIARYHSSTPRLNCAYKNSLIRNYKKLIAFKTKGKK